MCRPALCLVCLLVATTAGAQDRVLRTPPKDAGVETLEQRRALQEATAYQFGVFTGFGFSDAVAASGIDFVHESVDDSLRNWTPAHYDHGNSLAVADVDGDGNLDLYFLTQLGANQLYRNLGDGSFENVTERAGIGLADRISVAASFADIDNDGDADLFVTSVRGGNALFINDGEGRFLDATEGSGLAYSGHSSGAAFLDYDSDGLLDLFVTNVGVYTNDELGRGGFFRALPDAFLGHRFPERTEKSRLYRNLGEGRFEDVSAAADWIDSSWSGDAFIIDLNEDRLTDLYVLNMQGDDHYSENQGGGRFRERTPELFPKTSWGAMSGKFFDYDNDGLFDLMVTDMHSDMHDLEVNPLVDEKRKYVVPLDDGENNIAGNAFYEQQADGSFTEISDRIGAENFWPWGLSVGDLNADGFEDVFVASSMNFPFRYGVNTVLLNDRGNALRDSEFILGIEPRQDGRTHIPLFTLDCDGADVDNPVCQSFEGTLLMEGAVGTRTSAIFDLDADGDLDIVTGEFNDRPQVLISDLSDKRRVKFLEISLRGTASNRDGLGARVEVVTENATYTRFHDGKSGYLTQSSMPIYFGLAEAAAVERVEIDWPSGAHQTVTEGLELNTRIEIEEAADTPADG